jgi:hypothetical protein
MSDDLRKQIYLNFSQCETEELLEIWRAHDCNEWSEMTFGVIGEILRERGVEPPPQGKPVYQEHKLKSEVVREDQQEQHVVYPPKDEAIHAVYKPQETIPSRPRCVIYAVYLAFGVLVVSVALAVANLAAGQPTALTTHPWFGAIVGFTAVGLLLLDAFFLYLTWHGGNVARIFYVGLTLFSIVSTFTGGGWTQSFTTQPLRTGLSALMICLDLVAVILLVLPASNAWFRATQAARAMKQTAQIKKSTPRKRRASTRPAEWSPDAWLGQYTFGTVAVSLAVGLLASWLAYKLVLQLQRPQFSLEWSLNSMYATYCLPVQAITLILGAVIGAVGTRIPEERWRRATYGVWIAAIVAILVAMIGVGVVLNLNW